jgi:hypothetical protein
VQLSLKLLPLHTFDVRLRLPVLHVPFVWGGGAPLLTACSSLHLAVVAHLQVMKQQLPSSGVLCVTFVSSHRASWEAQPLTDTEFDSMWRCLVHPRRLATTAVALEQTLNISFGGSGLGDTVGAGDAAGCEIAGLGPGGSSRSSSKFARGAAAAAAPIVTGRSWYDVGASMAGSVAGAAGGSGGNHVHAVTDGWKMHLLQVRPSTCASSGWRKRVAPRAYSDCT